MYIRKTVQYIFRVSVKCVYAMLDDKMHTELSTMKPPRSVPVAKVRDARPKPRTKMIAAIKPKPVPKSKVIVVQQRMMTKHTAVKGRPRTNNCKPSPKPNPIRQSTKLCNLMLRMKRDRVAKPRLASKLQSVPRRKPRTVPQRPIKLRSSKALTGKVAGMKTASKSTRTIKNIKVCFLYMSHSSVVFFYVTCTSVDMDAFKSNYTQRKFSKCRRTVLKL